MDDELAIKNEMFGVFGTLAIFAVIAAIVWSIVGKQVGWW